MKCQTVLVIAAFSCALLDSGCAGLSDRPADSSRLTPPHPELAGTRIPDGLGVNIHFYDATKNDLAMLAPLHIGIVRMDVGWGAAEKTPGVYDFSAYDHLTAMLAQRNIRLLFILDYGNPLYDQGLSPHTQIGRDAYARFCAALAARYKDKHVIWELWNEPNIGFWKPKPNVDDYVAWCNAVVPAIRAADPRACVIGPASSQIAFPFLKDCFERGFLNLVDGVSVHPYRSAEKGPETVLPEYARLEAMIRHYKSPDDQRSIPIISGEWGYTAVSLSPERQGKYLARQWLINEACHLPISIWYDWHDDGRDPKEGEHHFGTVTYDYQPKPAYHGMETLITELNGYVPVGRVPSKSPDDYIIAFRDNHRFKLAVWTTADPHEIDLGQGLTLGAAKSFQGVSQTAPNPRHVAIDDGPIYLTLTGSAPDRIQNAGPLP